MILVEPAVLTEEESALGFEVSDDEWNSRYRPWLGRTDLEPARPSNDGRITTAGAGKPAADSTDAAEYPEGATQA